MQLGNNTGRNPSGGRPDMVKILIALLCTVKALVDPSVRPKCYITGQATMGWNQVNSPGFPSPFPGKLDCLYVLSAPAGQKIELLFENFAIPASPGCKKAGLEILDPTMSKVPGRTAILCGSTKPEPFKSKGNKVFLKLSSNVRGAEAGELLIKYRIKQKGMDTSGPGGSPGNGTPMGVFGPLDQAPPAAVGGGAPGVGGGAPKGPRKSPKKAPKKAPPKAKAHLKNGSVKQMIAKMAEESDKTGQQNNRAKGGGNAHMRGHCQDGWKPGMPCMQKKTKELGSKSDLETKKLLKMLGMGVGVAGACVVVWLLFRHFTGQTNGGIPEPENALPEGKVPTHLAAIQEHKAKMKAMGKEYPEDSD